MSSFLTADSSRRHLLRREGIVVLKLLAPFVAILCVVSYFHEFVWHAISVNKAINGLIIISALYGVVMIVVRLIGAQQDFYVIERFGREAMQGVYMRQLLEQPWLKRRYVRHYLGHIAMTGGSLSTAIEQNAIESELRALSAEYEHKLELPQFIVGFMVAMGLLGTFIGLLDTLTGISEMLDGFGGTGSNMDEQFMKLVGQLRTPLAGMGIAFSASMFGLVTSLMLAIMMINLRRYISRVISCARNVMHDLTELNNSKQSASTTQLTPEQIAAMAAEEEPKSGRAAPGSLSDGEMTLQDMVYQAHDTNMMMASRIDGLTQKIERLFQVIEGGVQATHKTNELLGFGPRMKDTTEKMLEELKSITGGQIEQRIFTQRLLDAGGETARILNGIAGGQVIQHKFSQHLIDIGGEQLRLLGGLADGQIEQQKSAQRLIDSGGEATRLLDGIARYQQDAHAGQTLSLKDIADKLVKVEDSTNAAGRSLEAINENFMKMGAYSGVAETISSGVGHQTLLLETLIKEDRNLQKRLVSIQQDIRERSLPPEDGQDAALAPPVI